MAIVKVAEMEVTKHSMVVNEEQYSFRSSVRSVCVCMVSICPVSACPLSTCPVSACPVSTCPVQTCVSGLSDISCPSVSGSYASPLCIQLTQSCPVHTYPVYTCPVHTYPVHTCLVCRCPIRTCPFLVLLAVFKRGEYCIPVGGFLSTYPPQSLDSGGNFWSAQRNRYG